MYLILYFLFYWIWQGPQTFIGWFLSLGKSPSHIILAGVEIYRVKWVWPGLCLGKYIFISDTTYGTFMLRHQIGHFIQSNKLGPLYIPFILIPAFIGLCISLGSNQNFSLWYTETWANKLSAKKK